MKIYSWNIALHGKHLFKTADYSDRPDAIERIRIVLTRKFRISDGFTIDETSHNAIVYSSHGIAQ